MNSTERATPELRGQFPWLTRITTRWHDNDVFGHVNNVVYYGWIDTAVNRWMIESGAFDQFSGPLIALTAETGCSYFKSLAFPDDIDAGLRVQRMGTTSVEDRIGIFKSSSETSAAIGRFVQVYVDRQTRRPAQLPEAMRAKLAVLETSS